MTASPTDVVTALFGKLHALASDSGGRFHTVGVFDNAEDLLDAAAAETAKKGSVWWGVHPLAARPERRGGNDDVAEVRCLVADLDWADPDQPKAHKATGLPTEAEVRERLARFEHQPSIVINSGHGLQPYWLLFSPVDPQAGHELTLRLHAALQAVGLDTDRSDLASVLRVPGSVSFKPDCAPVDVIVESADLERVYMAQYLAKRLPAATGTRTGSGGGNGGVKAAGLDAVLAQLDADGRDQDAAALTVLCRRYGGHHPFLTRAGYVEVTRPDKSAGGSASVGFVGPGIVKMFTSGWEPFTEGHRYIVGPDGTSLVDENDELRFDPAGPAPTEPCTLDHAHAVARRWLGDEYDLDALNVTLAAAAVEALEGDPIWLLIVSGSGNAKTETVQAFGGAGAHVTSTITSVGALLSASPRKEKAKDATGGLLRKVGDRGIIVIKDFTSILSMDRNGRAEVLAALREVYDGRWERNVGTDGGRTLTWAGRIVVIGAVTTAWDRAHDVISAMGDRFVLLRMDSTQGRINAGRRSIGNTGSEAQMRAELADAVAGVLAGVDAAAAVDLTVDETERLLTAADLVTIGRTAVDYDYRGDVIDAHAPEMPTRFAKQLAQVVRGAVAIGIDRTDALRLAVRCARDSMPPLRLAILTDVAAHPDSTTTEVRRRLDKPRATVDRQLQSLHMLGLLECSENEGYAGHGVQWRYTVSARFDVDWLTP